MSPGEQQNADGFCLPEADLLCFWQRRSNSRASQSASEAAGLRPGKEGQVRRTARFSPGSGRRGLEIHPAVVPVRHNGLAENFIGPFNQSLSWTENSSSRSRVVKVGASGQAGKRPASRDSKNNSSLA